MTVAENPILASATNNRTASSHFLVMDFARGLAAFLVMVYHVVPLFFPDFIYLERSYLAVDLFFLMSGYVVARAYEEKILDKRLSIWRFSKIRFLQLYPLYILSCGLGLSYFLIKIGLAHDDAPTIGAILWAAPSALAILPCVNCTGISSGLFPFSPAAWSLSMEFWFNVVYAFLVFRLSDKVLSAVCVLSGVLLIIAAIDQGSLDQGMRISNLMGGVYRFWFSFSLGVLMFRKGAIASRVPRFLWLVFPLFFVFPAIPKDAVFIQLLWVLVVFPIFVFLFSNAPVPKGVSVLFDHFGRLSYGLYILHGPVLLIFMGAVKFVWGDRWIEVPLISLVGCVSVIVLATAVLTYLVDEPLRQRLRSRI